MYPKEMYPNTNFIHSTQNVYPITRCISHHNMYIPSQNVYPITRCIHYKLYPLHTYYLKTKCIPLKNIFFTKCITGH